MAAMGRTRGTHWRGLLMTSLPHAIADLIERFAHNIDLYINPTASESVCLTFGGSLISAARRSVWNEASAA